jgi:hypothetical protein
MRMETTSGLTKTRLTRRLRLIIMSCIIVAFFIISPALIIYTAGIRFNKTTHQWESTGALSIDVLPDDATIYINNILITDSIPIRLAGLAPGTYHITIEKSGFHRLVTDISIRPGETTYLKNITLLKKSIPQLSSTQLVTSTKSNLPVFPYQDENKNNWIFTSGTIKNTTEKNTYFSFSETTKPDEIITINNNFALIRFGDTVSIIKNPGIPGQEEKNIPATNWYFHKKTKEWRLASMWQIASVYENGDYTILYRSDEPIKSIHPLDEDGSVLLVINNKLIAFNPGYYISQELAEFDAIDNVQTNIQEQKITLSGAFKGIQGTYDLVY